MKDTSNYWKNNEFINELIDLLPSPVFWKDTASVFLGCNKAFSDLAGLDSPQDIIGKTDYDLPWGQFQAKSYIQDDQDIIQSKKPKLNIEESQTLSNQKDMVLLTSKIPLFSRNGEIMGVLGIFHDITERKQMELSLAQAKNAAEAANHAKSEFIANMSHDIRTPLAGVVGMSHLLEEDAVNPIQKQYAHWIGQSGNQLLDMLNGILDVVSAENVNETDLHQERFNIRLLVEDILQLERPSALLKGLEFITHVDEDIPHCLISDVTKLHRIILNLLGNAIKFTETGHVKLNVSLIERRHDCATVRFEVSDTGIGISPEMQGMVFDRFFRVTPAYRGVYTGNGVGLHIAQSYANLLGGKINLTSELGAGATFCFDLLLQIAHVAGAPVMSKKTPKPLTKTSPTPRPLANKAPKNAPHLLLIEDSSIALLVLENMVADAGFRFTSAVDGETALKLATTQSFDLILTDLGLPGISGIDFTAALRAFEVEKNKSPIPIIGLTAHANAKIKQNCIQSGMNAVFSKVVTKEILEKIESTWLSSRPIENTTDLPNREYEFFDPALALNNLNNNKALFHTLLPELMDQYLPEDIAFIKTAHAKKDWHRVVALALKIKSGAICAGATKLCNACDSLEYGDRDKSVDELEKLYHQFIQIAEDTRWAMKTWFEKR